MEQIYLKRLSKFVDWMKEKNINVALITSPTNIYYFTGFYSNPHERFMGLFIQMNNEPILIVPELDINAAKSKKVIREIFGYSDSVGPDSLIKEKIIINAEDSIGVEENLISLKRANWLKNIFNLQQFKDIDPGLFSMRLVKDEIEVRYLQEAAIFADKAIEYGIKALKVGKSELEIIAEIEFHLKKQGIEKMSFDTMVLTGEKTGLPHGKSSIDTIKYGDFVMFDLGVVVNGYCSDITRTIIIGEATEKQQEIYDTVLNAQLKAIEKAKPNVKAKEIDLAARNFITDKGYGSYFNHRVGHGLGLDVHETPSIHENNEEIIQVGMVFTIEPGIYLPNFGGVRIEDDILITENSSQVLTSFTKELIVI